MKKTPAFITDSLPNKEMSDLPRLALAVEPLCAQHPGQCGLLPLDDSLDAFAARYRLTEMAERTLGCAVLHLAGRYVWSFAICSAPCCGETWRACALAAG